MTGQRLIYIVVHRQQTGSLPVSDGMLLLVKTREGARSRVDVTLRVVDKRVSVKA
jgi:hypothetical protein